MRPARIILMLTASLWLVVAFGIAIQAQAPQQDAVSTGFLDVLDLPARIDEPRLSQTGDRYVLRCAVANRSGEQLLGLRLILLLLDPSGKLRVRLNWTEPAAVDPYSIKTFELHPPLKDLRKTDNAFLGVDEVIGRETIWQLVNAEKVLRSYARGQHDVITTVRTVANKFDSQPKVMPIIREQNQ